MTQGWDNSTAARRLRELIACFGAVFAFFLGMFIRYQLLGPLEENAFAESAFLQRQKGVPVSLARGYILDRHGTPLHCPYWDSALALFPEKVEDPESLRSWLNGLFGGKLDNLELAGARENGPFKVARELSPELIDEILKNPKPGLLVIPEEVRYGPGSLARHVVGHVRPNAYLNPGDNVGEGGLEKQYQGVLAGTVPAWAGTLVGGDGSELPGTGLRIAASPKPPADLYTTLDVDIQHAVEKVLDERRIRKGAVVVLDARTGEILAMASRPQFDQNHPEKSFNTQDAPFVNRAISAFVPGSVWKPVVLALALEKGYVGERETFLCQGKIKVGPTEIKCGHQPGGHGILSVEEALAQSCNSAFIQIALRVNPHELVDYARKCGFGEKTRIPLPEEMRGVLPDPSMMLLGDVANYAIGQGYLTVTPLQVASFFRAIVSGGKWIRPTLILGEKTEEREIFSEKTAVILENALLAATRHGTGQEAWVAGYGSAGKTGTAETGLPSGKTHAWFCGWAPILVPRYVVSVFVEEGGDGPGVAAPIFREILEEILSPDRF
ncbi:MAG TPA: penicillin-binding protein 2 [Firmicutes bacterium]|nr:penicillin-binding protein 2 [Candidatus Fermentithermobacillaceae bacterium]